MFTCSYCGQTYQWAACPYDGSVLSYPQQPQCPLGHDLTRLSPQYQNYQMYVANPFGTVAACPNCRTPYFYGYLSPELKMQFNRQRQALGCFIATAAMGSHLHPYVQSLREFRDNTLLQSCHKDTFEGLLKFYYRFSPSVARAMSRHKSLKFLLRYTIVYPVVFGIKMVLPIFNIVLGIEKDVRKRQRNNSPNTKNNSD